MAVARPKLSVAQLRDELPRSLLAVIDAHNALEKRLKDGSGGYLLGTVEVTTAGVQVPHNFSGVPRAAYVEVRDLTEGQVYLYSPYIDDKYIYLKSVPTTVIGEFVSLAAGTGALGTGSEADVGDVVERVIDMGAGSDVTSSFNSPITVDNQITENTFIGASRPCLLILKRPTTVTCRLFVVP